MHSFKQLNGTRYFSLFILLIFTFTSRSEEVRLSDLKRLADGRVQVTVTGNSGDPVTIQASSDLTNWVNLQTFPLVGAPVSYVDTAVSSEKRRHYRVKTTGAPPSAPVSLPDLADNTNRVFPAPEGFNTIQYAPDGKLGFIVWRDTDLLFRERATDGSWREQVVGSGGSTFKPYLVFDFRAPREDYRFQPSAVLLYDAQSNPHVFRASGQNIWHYTRSDSKWNLSESISNPIAGGNIEVLEGAVGVNNVFHFAALSSISPRKLTYGSNSGGQWNWTTISTVTDPPLTYWAPPFAARWLAMDVDSQNRAHIAYRTGLNLTYDAASHPRAYSELRYASNASGQWTSTVVSKPRDLSGEAANGASIAIGPDNKPRILSWYDERGDGGSAEESRLYFHERDGNGNWNKSVVVNRANGYIAGDDNKGSGFSPYLRFDRNGRAHILFADHASEHFGGIGQQEYAGNLRHAWWNGSSWSFQTIFSQNSPLRQQVVYPSFALSGSEMAVVVLQRDTEWNFKSFPPLSKSKYYFRFFTKPLP